MHRRSYGRPCSVAGTALTALLGAPDSVEAMGARKYTAKKVGEGRALLVAVAGPLGMQSERTGDRVSAPRRQGDHLSDALAPYPAPAGTARAVFCDATEAMTAPGVTGSHRTTYSTRLARTRAFTVEARNPDQMLRFTDERSDVDVTDTDSLAAALAAAGMQITAQDGPAECTKSWTGTRGWRSARPMGVSPYVLAHSGPVPEQPNPPPQRTPGVGPLHSFERRCLHFRRRPPALPCGTERPFAMHLDSEPA